MANSNIKRISGNVAERIDLEIRKENTMNFRFIFSATDGTALDLTTYTSIEFEVFNSQSSTVITADLATGLTISGAGNNILTLVKDDTETNITAGNGYTYTLTLTNATYKRAVLSGQFFVKDGLTDVTAPKNIEGVLVAYIEGAYYTITVSTNL
jgi:hypothetical protein